MKIIATYTGKNDSRGFKNGQQYELDVGKNPFTPTTAVKTKDGLSCPYGSAKAFLMNWDKIKVLEK